MTKKSKGREKRSYTGGHASNSHDRRILKKYATAGGEYDGGGGEEGKGGEGRGMGREVRQRGRMERERKCDKVGGPSRRGGRDARAEGSEFSIAPRAERRALVRGLNVQTPIGLSKTYVLKRDSGNFHREGVQKKVMRGVEIAKSHLEGQGIIFANCG